MAETVDTTYIVYTDYNPQQLSAATVAIYEMWVKFAMGGEQLGGHFIKHPTGRYASSITRRQYSPTRIAIIANEKVAPEAAILELGHEEIDLKESLQKGKAYPIHRGAKSGTSSGGYSWSGRGYGQPQLQPGSRRKSLWAKPRAQGRTGFARIPTHITAENQNSWIIPPMPAYSPAGHLVEILKAANGR